MTRQELLPLHDRSLRGMPPHAVPSINELTLQGQFVGDDNGWREPGSPRRLGARDVPNGCLPQHGTYDFPAIDFDVAVAATPRPRTHGEVM